MPDQDKIDYSKLRPRHIPVPDAVPAGDWWRRRWVLTFAAEPGNEVELPPPPPELGEFTAVVSLTRLAAGEAALEVLTREQVLSPEAYSYASIIARHLRDLAPENFLVDGHANHPLLNVVRG